MALIEKITEYHEVVFANAEASRDASSKLMDFVNSSPATLVTMVGPRRVVMWEQSSDFDNRVLYLSPGALSILSRLVPLPPSSTVGPSQLPPTRAMLLGDASDWAG